MQVNSHSATTRCGRLVRMVGTVLVLLLLATSVANASEERQKYNSDESGHPLRVVAYILHPIGVILDRLFLRPAYWLGSQEPIKTLVGRTD